MRYSNEKGDAVVDVGFCFWVPIADWIICFAEYNNDVAASSAGEIAHKLSGAVIKNPLGERRATYLGP